MDYKGLNPMIHRFDAWLYRVDGILIDKIGLDSGSMEDWLWHDAFERGLLPVDAVKEFMIANWLEITNAT